MRAGVKRALIRRGGERQRQLRASQRRGGRARGKAGTACRRASTPWPSQSRSGAAPRAPRAS
eukprot:518245-Rhodomonas_salina.1